jgi:hypothetical protein
MEHRLLGREEPIMTKKPTDLDIPAVRVVLAILAFGTRQLQAGVAEA